MDELYKYTRKQAYEEMLKTSNQLNSQVHDSFNRPQMVLNEPIYKLSRFDYPAWIGRLIFNGRKIDESLNNYLKQIISQPSRYYSKEDKKSINSLLIKLLEYKETIADFEHDINQFINNIVVTDLVDKNSYSLPANQIMTEVQNTYRQVYELCVFKLNSISSGRITASNIAISLVALAVAILSLFLTISNNTNG